MCFVINNFVFSYSCENGKAREKDLEKGSSKSPFSVYLGFQSCAALTFSKCLMHGQLNDNNNWQRTCKISWQQNFGKQVSRRLLQKTGVKKESSKKAFNMNERTAQNRLPVSCFIRSAGLSDPVRVIQLLQAWHWQEIWETPQVLWNGYNLSHCFYVAVMHSLCRKTAVSRPSNTAKCNSPTTSCMLMQLCSHSSCAPFSCSSSPFSLASFTSINVVTILVQHEMAQMALRWEGRCN